MENEFVAFIKGSKRSSVRFRLGIVVRRKNSLENYYAYREEHRLVDGTSAREEYLAISLAAKSVPCGSRLVIYTNNLTAVRVFSGVWKAKKHQDIVEDFHKNCDFKEVEVKHSSEGVSDPFIALGMEAAEKLCYRRFGLTY